MSHLTIKIYIHHLIDNKIIYKYDNLSNILHLYFYISLIMKFKIIRIVYNVYTITLI